MPKNRYAREDWFDVWLPNLAPSAALIASARHWHGAAGWRRFVRRYEAEMARPDASHVLDALAALSHVATFSVGCYCEDEGRCHRGILRRFLAKHGLFTGKAAGVDIPDGQNAIADYPAATLKASEHADAAAEFVKWLSSPEAQRLLREVVKAQGFNVYSVLDASGDPSEFASRITMARLAQAGVVPTSANAVLCEFQQHWNRGMQNERFAALYGMVAPNYVAVIESYTKAQEVAKGQ